MAKQGHYLAQIQHFSPSCPQEAADQRLILELCLADPGRILTRENKVSHLTSSGLILNQTLDKVLMVHHHIYRTWTWTGGHADGDEDLLAIALKEGKEETGLTVLRPCREEMASLDIIPVFGHEKNGRYVSAHLHLNAAYLLVADEGAPLQVRPAENSGVQWVSLSEVKKYSGEPALISIFAKMLRRLNSKEVTLANE